MDSSDKYPAKLVRDLAGVSPATGECVGTCRQEVSYE